MLPIPLYQGPRHLNITSLNEVGQAYLSETCNAMQLLASGWAGGKAHRQALLDFKLNKRTQPVTKSLAYQGINWSRHDKNVANRIEWRERMVAYLNKEASWGSIFTQMQKHQWTQLNTLRQRFLNVAPLGG